MPVKAGEYIMEYAEHDEGYARTFMDIYTFEVPAGIIIKADKDFEINIGATMIYTKNIVRSNWGVTDDNGWTGTKKDNTATTSLAGGPAGTPREIYSEAMPGELQFIYYAGLGIQLSKNVKLNIMTSFIDPVEIKFSKLRAFLSGTF